jgi:hypothetical protein
MSAPAEVVVRDGRYPYTYAYDYIRGETCEHNPAVGFATPRFNRSDCAQICKAIAPALGLTAEALAVRIADYAKASGEAS